MLGLRWLARIGAALLVGTLAVGGYRLVRTELAAEVYRERLEALASDYASLRDRYEEAVRRTAVTELRVEDGELSVAVRRADGEVRVIPTPYDPRSEIYVDYAVQDGRLWIRRVFADDTPPKEGVLVEPRLDEVDWEAADAAHGKAAYRTLGEGRWVVTVTGNGALGLERVEPDAEPELAPPPPVRDFEPVARRVDDRLGRIRPEELFAVLADAARGASERPAARADAEPGAEAATGR